jgi:hypothetical protein
MSKAALTTNYDEALAGNNPLPKLMVARNGRGIDSAKAWIARRRPEIMTLFEQHVYGRTPARWGKVTFETRQVKPDALGGQATRKLVHVALHQYPAWPGMEVMVYIPNGPRKPAPCFVGLSFGGNHAVSAEPDIPLSSRWIPANEAKGVVDHHATGKSRGTENGRWPLEFIIGQGYALATAYYGDMEPDHTEGWKDGLRAVLSKEGTNTVWRNGSWGAIGAWAWGLSRILDYLETDAQVDAAHCAVIGHSRLGKAALWAGAQDQRFGAIISNESGKGGAALMRRNFGETIAAMTHTFPHWFTPKFSCYSNNESACPVDMHMLIALAAPRPLYIGSAAEDGWADPRGEFLAGQYAEPAFALFGKTGIGGGDPPALDTPVGEAIGYHLRTGKHDMTHYDWVQYLKFASRHFKK